MSRATQLKALSQEHKETVEFTKEIANIAETGSEADLLAAIERVKKYYDEELEVHFQHEEKTIFAPIYKQYKDYAPGAAPLLKQHGAIRMLIPGLCLENAKEGLSAFAQLLENHTNLEEEQLFSIVEKEFTQEQLNAVLHFKAVDKKG